MCCSIESHLGCLHDDLRLAEDKLSTAVARYDKSRYKHGLCGLEHIFLRYRKLPKIGADKIK